MSTFDTIDKWIANKNGCPERAHERTMIQMQFLGHLFNDLNINTRKVKR